MRNMIITSISDLKKGEQYHWTAGADPELKVEYIGTAKENPNIKPRSSVGKGYIFKFIDKTGPFEYVEVGRISIYQGIIVPFEKYKHGAKIKSHIYKRGTKIEKLSIEQIKKNIDNAYPTDAKKIKNQIDGVEREGFITIGKKLDLYNYWHKKFGETIDESIENEKQHELEIAEHELTSAKNKIEKIDLNEIDKNELRRDYPKKNAQWVWDNWTQEQREHFLSDHFSNEDGPTRYGKTFNADETVKLNWNKLPTIVKGELANHVATGRYEHGTKIESTNERNENYYENVVNELLNDNAIATIRMKTYGCEIQPYSPIDDAYMLPIKLTRSDMLALIIKSNVEFMNYDEKQILNELQSMTRLLMKK